MTTPVYTGSEVAPDVLYTLGEAKRRLGWGNHAMRTARRQGLEVKYVAGRAYVLGCDLIEHILKNGKVRK